MIFKTFHVLFREAAKKFIFSGPATKRGRVKSLATKEITFFEALKKFPQNVATKFEWGEVRP